MGDGAVLGGGGAQGGNAEVRGTPTWCSRGQQEVWHVVWGGHGSPWCGHVCVCTCWCDLQGIQPPVT